MGGLEDEAAAGKTFELGGPTVYTFKEIYDYILKEVDRPRLVLPLPFFIAKPIGLTCGALFKLWPFHGPPITGDQVDLLRSDNVVSTTGDVGTIQDLGVTKPESVEAIVPNYLWRFRPNGQFHEMKDA